MLSITEDRQETKLFQKEKEGRIQCLFSFCTGCDESSLSKPIEYLLVRDIRAGHGKGKAAAECAPLASADTLTAASPTAFRFRPLLT